MKFSKLYIIVISIVFIIITIIFCFFPRSTFSELERRDLTSFPSFSLSNLASGEFTSGVSHWFSDTEPYRDFLMEASMRYRSFLRFDIIEDGIHFHPSDKTSGFEVSNNDEDNESFLQSDENKEANEALISSVMVDENAKLADAGIIIVGAGNNIRALMAYGGGANSGKKFAETANIFKRRFGDDIEVYVMPVPIAIEFYCPEKAKHYTKPQLPTIENVKNNLSDSVKYVDAYNALASHINEDIYSRTDHHWTPKGAFYAAKAFAEVANVDFKSLNSAYAEHVIHRYVGSMYGYSHDISIKDNPEDFIYYTPTDVEYKTTYWVYTLDSAFNIVSESSAQAGPFFYRYHDGSSNAYCTFMGGDMKITQVRTNSPTNRHLLIIKDSFGNAIPGYLFYSFSEIHVIDTRYFTRNLTDYILKNAITDILFVYNIYNVCSSRLNRKNVIMLDQDTRIFNVSKKESTNLRTQDSSIVSMDSISSDIEIKRDSIKSNIQDRPLRDSTQYDSIQNAI